MAALQLLLTLLVGSDIMGAGSPTMADQLSKGSLSLRLEVVSICNI